MVLSFLSKSRNDRLRRDAAVARTQRSSVMIAFIAVATYNLVGVFDIISTVIAIELGVAEEANPLMRAVMDNYGVAWIATKLMLQFLISAMVLWFPHRIVLAMFIAAISTNAYIVFNNFLIAFGA